jgi:hypothetical protein
MILIVAEIYLRALIFSIEHSCESVGLATPCTKAYLLSNSKKWLRTLR